jgi:hypothetical protein
MMLNVWCSVYLPAVTGTLTGPSWQFTDRFSPPLELCGGTVIEIVSIPSAPSVAHAACWCAEPLPLQGRVDAEPRQVPVGESRMGFIHLAHDRERVLTSVRSDRVDEQADDGVAVGLAARREPEGDSGAIAQAPDGLLSERPSAERRDEGREMREVLARLRIHPSLDGVARKRQDKGVDDRLLVGLEETRNLRSVHSATVPGYAPCFGS